MTATPKLACFSCGTRTDADDCPQCGGMTAEVISEYTDHDALEDGVLVAITNRDRCTRGLFEDLARLLPEHPPEGWPVALLQWCSGNAKDHGPTRAIAACKGLIARDAPAVLAHHKDGEPLRLFYQVKNAERAGILHSKVAVPEIVKLTPLSGVDTDPETEAVTVIWLLPNECGGVTMMYPSDY